MTNGEHAQRPIAALPNGRAGAAAFRSERGIHFTDAGGLTKKSELSTYYAEPNYNAAMQMQLETGLLRYCGVVEPRFELLFDALKGPSRQKRS